MVDSVSRPSMPANLGFPELWLPTYYHYPFPLLLSLSHYSFVRSFAHVASATMFQTTRERESLLSSIVLLSGGRMYICTSPLKSLGTGAIFVSRLKNNDIFVWHIENHTI